MDYYALDILKLLNAIAEETNHTLAHADIDLIYDDIKDKDPVLLSMSGDYIYRKLYLRVRDATPKHNTSIRLNKSYIEALAHTLRYKSYQDFLSEKHPDKKDALVKCIGNWYSYVRCNSGKPDVLVSPVRIYAEGKKICMELKGPERSFRGTVKLNGNCLYCFLESDQSKNLHIVLKTGLAIRPEVLQGVFSGISSGGDPIAGREVFIRQEKDFSLLKPRKFRITDTTGKKNEEQAVADYFSKKEKNILKGGVASSFILDDLDQ